MQQTTNRNTIIGFDAKRIVRNGTGLGSYGRTLINSLADLAPDLQLRLYAPDRGRDDLRRQVFERPNIHFFYPKGMHFRLQRDLWRTKGIVSQLKSDGVAMYHGLSGELPVGLHRAGIPGLVTIHDLIFLRHPEFYHWLDVQIYRHKFYQTLREASRIVAISECTKRDIMYYGNFPEDHIDTIYQSCDTRFKTRMPGDQLAATRQKYQLPARYLLSVGTIEERKNVLLAVKALEALPTDLHLVLVGRRTKYAQRVESYAQLHGLAKRLHFLHGVPNDDLFAIYQQAECFVYPSYYEGFGLPIIEALQSGLPVVAATGSCLEEAGGPDCLYVAPNDVRGMAEAIIKSLDGADGRAERIAAGQHYVERFENSDTATQMLKEYQLTLQEGGSFQNKG